MLPKTVAECAAVRAKLSNYPYFAEALELALAYGGEVYWVGGKVYRTLVHLEHGGDYGADTCDWDFFVTGGNPWIQFSHPNWEQTRGFGTAPSSGKGVLLVEPYSKNLPSGQKIRFSKQFKLKSNPKVKIDIIFEQDLISEYPQEKLRGIDLYFKLVPLDIQAVGIHKAGSLIMGHGLKAIQEKKITIQNPTKTVRGADVNKYAWVKTQVFRENGFELVPYSPPAKPWMVVRLWNWLKSFFSKH